MAGPAVRKDGGGWARGTTAGVDRYIVLEAQRAGTRWAILLNSCIQQPGDRLSNDCHCQVDIEVGRNTAHSTNIREIDCWMQFWNACVKRQLVELSSISTRGLLATDHVILNHGQVTWTTPELAPPLLTTTPHQREEVSALDRFNVHRCPTRRVFSGTGLELVTRQATVRYLYHPATAATVYEWHRHFREDRVLSETCEMLKHMYNSDTLSRNPAFEWQASTFQSSSPIRHWFLLVVATHSHPPKPRTHRKAPLRYGVEESDQTPVPKDVEMSKLSQSGFD
ncbi:uncharacterized protein TNCV_1108731 [Trichonephila clavipes]|nr:uncharacterized protein TNCV_1108731 [Trichonephila clavipes]